MVTGRIRGTTQRPHHHSRDQKKKPVSCSVVITVNAAITRCTRRTLGKALVKLISRSMPRDALRLPDDAQPGQDTRQLWRKKPPVDFW